MSTVDECGRLRGNEDGNVMRCDVGVGNVPRNLQTPIKIDTVTAPLCGVDKLRWWCRQLLVVEDCGVDLELRSSLQVQVVALCCILCRCVADYSSSCMRHQ